MRRILFNGLQRQYRAIKNEILDITNHVYSSGRMLDGVFTKTFEDQIALLTGRKYAIAVSSGTMALYFALLSLINVPGNKQKIVIPAQSYIATVNTVIESGFEPVFCDVSPTTGLIDIQQIPVSIDEIAAIVVVNLFGNMVNYDEISAYTKFFTDRNIPLIEDAAQSLGAKYDNKASGGFGDISILSFDPTKNLPNYGSGGMILTDDTDIAAWCWSLRDNGKDSAHSLSGLNSKLSEVDAAQLSIKLKYFNSWQERRSQIAEYYTNELSQFINIPLVTDNAVHGWSRFVAHTQDRAGLLDYLGSQGIDTKIHYELPMNLQPISLCYAANILISAEEFSKTCFSLPMYPELTDAEVEHIIECIIRYTS